MTSNTLSILPEFEVFQFLIVLDLFIAFNLIPKKTPEVLFTSYMAFVLPTLYTRGSGLTTQKHKNQTIPTPKSESLVTKIPGTL